MAGNYASKFQKMMVIGGCALSLERDAHATTEIIDFKAGAVSAGPSLAIPARAATAHFMEKLGQVWVIGGCRGPKDHLKEIQISDLKNEF